MAYATRNRRPPRTLTDSEVAKVLKVSGESATGFRDHLILSFALGSALRESEIVALDVEDVAKPGPAGKLLPKRTIQLRVFKRGGGHSDPTAQRVPLSDSTFYKLDKYLRATGFREGPLFRSRKGGARLSSRAVRALFATWQKRAGFDRPFSFHHLRHTSITNFHRLSRDVRGTQKFARHSNINTTTIYEHASDEEVLRVAKRLTA